MEGRPVDQHIRERIFVAGHRGMVGSAIFNSLSRPDKDYVFGAARGELDLLSQSSVYQYLGDMRPTQIYLSAAKVGGIHANNEYPAEFIYENLQIQCNIIHGAFKAGVKKILFLGSSCIYPKNSIQPIREDQLLTGLLEATNEPYAVAKIAGIKLCESYNRQYGMSHGIDYRCVMPTNLYGPGDNYHSLNSHVIPGLIKRIHNAKICGEPIVKIWGSGKPMREFLYVEDLADACIFVMNICPRIYLRTVRAMQSHINVGTGSDIAIGDLARLISKVIGYDGSFEFDTSMPDGTMRKVLDTKLINMLGWVPKVSLKNGLAITYNSFLNDGSRSYDEG